MHRSYTQEALNRTLYIEGTEIQEHVKLLQTRKVAVDNLCESVMTDETWRGIIIRSIPPTPKWLLVIPSLYAMSTSADIVSTLFAHRMIVERDIPSKTTTAANSLNTALAAKTTEGCTNPNCKVKKRSTHTTLNCYWPGGRKEGQFPRNFGQKNRANTATSTGTSNQSTPNQPEHFFLSALVQDTPGRSGVLINIPIDSDHCDPPMALISKGFENFQKGKTPTFMDSRASNTMFISKDVFTKYKPITPHKGDSAKAVDGNFEIVGEGSVVQCYQVDGKEPNMNYTHALHTPTLNANLISISAFDKAGLTTTFGNGKGVVKRADGTIVLAGQNVNGMYLLETFDNAPITPLAMTSLSQPASLQQWH